MLSAIEYLTLACLPIFLVLDRIAPGRRFSAPRWWKARALLVTVFNFALATAVTLLWARLLGDFHILDLSGLGIVPGAVLGILVYELIHYWYHRAAHKNGFLWRWAHQMHHSAESIDVLGAYYLHPLDTFFFTTWSSLVFFPLLGLNAGAAIVAAFFLTFNAVFQHSQMRTPRWLGYVIQRPESHCVHHERGLHRYNYSDLPLWDMAFGTFENPARWEGQAGFYDGASSRVSEMLLGHDVTEAAARESGPALEPSAATAPDFKRVA